MFTGLKLAPKKPNWMNPYATRPSANPHELKYNAVDQILDSMNLPNSLAQLIFNTTEAMGYQDILMSGKHFRPRVDGDDEYACINRCGDEISNSSIAKPTNISGFCSEIDVAEECIDKCTQPNGLWRYIHKNLKSAKDVVCMGEGKIQAFMEENQKGAVQCAEDVAGDNVKFFKAVKHIIDLYLKFEEAEDNKDACYELKYNAIDSSFGLLRKMCEMKIDERLWELGKSTVVVVLTLFSDGVFWMSVRCFTLIDEKYGVFELN
uniref:Uncharacterized protein n=1 Tax=Ditylenchus dipsaci TaxID=166011 RepID=A0A915E0W5_9BILA